MKKNVDERRDGAVMAEILSAAKQEESQALLLELMEKGVLTIPSKRAAELLSTTEQTLRRYAKRRPDRLTKVPWGRRNIRYRMDQIIELARTGLI